MTNKVKITSEVKKLGVWYKIPSDSVNSMKIQFEFAEDWNDLICVAQFTQGEHTYNMLITDNECVVPAELTEGEFELSVFGTKSDGTAYKATSVPLVEDIYESGFVGDGDTPIPPTPDLYEQLIDEFASHASTVNGLSGDVTVSAESPITITTDTENKDIEIGVTVDGGLDAQSSNPISNSAVVSALNTKLPLSGGTMQGNIGMGSNKITSVATPTATYDLTNKAYVDGYAVRKGTEGNSLAVAVGASAQATGSAAVAVGRSTTATKNQSVALGYNANSNANYAVQLGEGTNTNVGTLQFESYTLCDINGKVPNDRINIETTIDQDSTDDEIPSAKAVYTAVQSGGGSGGIPTSALVTSIDNTSTDSQVPSAKCVYDEISAIPVITVDSALSNSSENPVQNKIVKTNLDAKVPKGTQSGTYTLAVGSGSSATATKTTAVGNSAGASVSGAVAIGYNSQASASGAIQIGEGTNSNANTTQIRSYQLLDSTGKIPSARLDLSAYEEVSNKVTSISNASTDTEYPSAKCVYDAIQNALYVDTGDEIE